MRTVAVAVSGGGDGDGSGSSSSSSKRAVRWAAEKLSPRPDRLVLVHVETLVLEDVNPAAVLLKYISTSHVRTFVLGSRFPGVTMSHRPAKAMVENKQESLHASRVLGPKSRNIVRPSSSAETSHSNSAADSELSFQSKISMDVLEIQVEELRIQLESTIASYQRACKDLADAQHKVKMLTSHHIREEIKIAKEREDALRRTVAEEKTKSGEAVKRAEEAVMLLRKEAYERQKAQSKAVKETTEKEKIINELMNANIYIRYIPSEIEEATDSFSQSKLIGEGCSAKVYKGNVNRTPVAIKVLRQDSRDKKELFLKEVGILSKLRHPNIVLLLGACPESSCLVYEYLENGSLEKHLSCQKGNSPLSWFVRFKIAFEIASALAFLHSSKPETIIHRDLKPDNILLGKNHVSKISDVGLAKIIPETVPNAVTYAEEDSTLAGTFPYLDPEYLGTGTVRPKSDLYSFGVILLRLLTGRPPNRLVHSMETAFEKGSLVQLLDKSISDWPLHEADELAHIALACCRLRCRDRPDLESEVLPVLKRLADLADAARLRENSCKKPQVCSPI
ncbi:U-box domain-containing protein [Drosera capensis]